MKNTLQYINDRAINSPKDFIYSCEENYLNGIKSIAELISKNDSLKIVSIAGPSASGKTTTAHILCDLLKDLGEKTVVVSLDDFYLPEGELPILPNGKEDIESVNALDIKLINKCFLEIIKYGKTMLPKFDFVKKQRITESRIADITNHGIVIVEGLHALNPLITSLVPKENIFKIYISVNNSIDDNNGKLLSSRQIRLIRRTLRDQIYRGSSISYTLSLWKGVIEGEKEYLYSFKGSADVQIKTLHLYEPGVYKNDFISLKNQIDLNDPYYDYCIKIIDALDKVVPIDSNLVPDDSLIREFIGNGKYN